MKEKDDNFWGGVVFFSRFLFVCYFGGKKVVFGQKTLLFAHPFGFVNYAVADVCKSLFNVAIIHLICFSC